MRLRVNILYFLLFTFSCAQLGISLASSSPALADQDLQVPAGFDTTDIQLKLDKKAELWRIKIPKRGKVFRKI